ncbi:SWIM zinc finger family protein [Bacteroides faecis]|uniref:SWIM zinc finger family protein n=1 Tax=Bacteroides faecis TaxID=674529 RepID=UPI00286E92D4|nr:SWIM zinc finger family protein [Bacteroides faecis]MCS2478112.1 SWIM zinc finger family protein [Bacteroides faecis]
MITLDNFEAIVPFKILMRGQEYYELGAVSDLEEASSGEWTATVDGTRSYTVEISLEGDKVDSWYCDCPYDGGICKHVVATLFAIRDNSEKVSRSVFSKMSVLEDDGDEEMDVEESVDLERIEDTVLYSPVDVDIQQCLSFIKPQELSRFICEYASTNQEFKTALLDRFITKELSKTSKDKNYRKEIQKIFENSFQSKKSRYHNRYDDFSRDWETVFSQLDTFLEKADFFLKLESLDDTIAIALQTLRSIGENYDDELLYDDDISASDYCEQAGDLILKVVRHPKTTQQQKTGILQELCQIAGISIYHDYDIYDVDDLMMQINLSIQSADKALELIDKLLEERKDSYDLYQLVLRKVDMLLGQKEQEKADDTIRQYLYLSEIREMEVKKLMEREQYDEAVRLLDEGIELSKKEEYDGTTGKWLKLKLKIFERTNRTSEVIDTCRLLFISGREQLEYYHKLKTLIPKEQWKVFLDEMMKEVPFNGYFSFDRNVEAEIYVEEKEDERLFHLLSSAGFGQLEALMQYAHHLKNSHSEQLIDMYISILIDYAERNIGRKYYEQIARALLCMQELNGGKVAVKQLVEDFRTIYKRRSAMMEELRRF